MSDSVFTIGDGQDGPLGSPALPQGRMTINAFRDDIGAERRAINLANQTSAYPHPLDERSLSIVKGQLVYQVRKPGLRSHGGSVPYVHSNLNGFGRKGVPAWVLEEDIQLVGVAGANGSVVDKSVTRTSAPALVVLIGGVTTIINNGGVPIPAGSRVMWELPLTEADGGAAADQLDNTRPGFASVLLRTKPYDPLMATSAAALLDIGSATGGLGLFQAPGRTSSTPASLLEEGTNETFDGLFKVILAVADHLQLAPAGAKYDASTLAKRLGFNVDGGDKSINPGVRRAIIAALNERTHTREMGGGRVLGVDPSLPPVQKLLLTARAEGLQQIIDGVRFADRHTQRKVFAHTPSGGEVGGPMDIVFH